MKRIDWKNKRVRIVLRVSLIIFAFIILAFIAVFFAMRLGWTKVQGRVDPKSNLYNSLVDTFDRKQQVAGTPKWAQTPDWKLIKAGLTKDKDIIDKASAKSGVPARVILSSVVVEQFRYFGSNREVFKQLFMPLSMLGNSVKFSYGIAGVKIATAQQIEKNLKDRKSPFYPGAQYEHLLDFKTKDHDKERMNRLTDDKNHYYSYLYTGLYIKEIETQWNNSDYDLSDRPEVLATLFNLGFAHSDPKMAPQIGGSDITVDGKVYTFGGLAYQFYYSNELGKTFPITQ